MMRRLANISFSRYRLFRSSVTSRETGVKFYDIPAYPTIGSLVPLLSGAPPLDDLDTMREFYPECRRRFGEFYKLGFPGIGKGIREELYLVSHPQEMMKVFRQESSQVPHPRGVFESE